MNQDELTPLLTKVDVAKSMALNSLEESKATALANFESSRTHASADPPVPTHIDRIPVLEIQQGS